MRADLNLVVVYVPTGCNLADLPSRGIKRASAKIEPSQRIRTRWDIHVQSCRRTLRHMRASPALGLPGSIHCKRNFDTVSSDSLTAQP